MEREGGAGHPDLFQGLLFLQLSSLRTLAEPGSG